MCRTACAIWPRLWTRWAKGVSKWRCLPRNIAHKKRGELLRIATQGVWKCSVERPTERGLDAKWSSRSSGVGGRFPNSWIDFVWFSVSSFCNTVNVRNVCMQNWLVGNRVVVESHRRGPPMPAVLVAASRASKKIKLQAPWYGGVDLWSKYCTGYVESHL